MVTLGLERGTVQIQKYSADWNCLFEREAALLRSVMGAAAAQIQHIGSTAIEGMPAKPIIDLIVVVGSLSAAGIWIPTLATLGYAYRTNDTVADRLLFVKGPTNRRTHHLSLAEVSSNFYIEKIVFRDYLRSHFEAFAEYVQLKMKLAQGYPQDRASYTEGKRTFVEHIIHIAKEAQHPSPPQP